MTLFYEEMNDAETIRLIRKIKTASWRSIFEVNWKMWELEDEITVNKHDLKKVGELYLKLRELTMERARLNGEQKNY